MQLIKKFDKQANFIFWSAIVIHLLVMCVEFGEWSVPFRGRLLQVAFLLCGIKILMSFYTKFEWAMMGFMGIIGAVSYYFTREKYVLYVMVLIFAAKSVSMNKVLKAVLYASLVSTVVIAILSVFNVGGLLVDVRDYGRGMIESRYCFGFGHANNIHGAVWYILSIAVWVYKDKLDWKHYLLFSILNIGLFVLTASKTGVLVTQMIIIGGIAYKYFDVIYKKLVTYICGAVAYAIILGLTLASVIVCNWTGYGPILELVNRITTNRVSLAYKYARISWWKIWMHSGVEDPIIDNGFAALGVNLGYVIWALYILLIAYLIYVAAKKRDGVLFVLLMCSVIYTYMESSFVLSYTYLLCNPVYLIAMHWYSQSKGLLKIEKVSEV